MLTRFENIPKEMAKLDQWVLTKRDSKVPLDKFANPASSTDPTTWTTFDIAMNLVWASLADNIGFVFNDNGYIGIDIDAGYDDEGFISQIGADIIGRCKSYTERSRSGRGFHIILKGSLPFKGKNNLKGVEIYKASRYFIMTGDVLLYREIAENQEAIDYVLDTYFKDELRDTRGNGVGNRIYNPIWEVPEDGRIKLRPVYPRIPNGCRNICLTSLAGMLHNQGYNRQQIYDELVYANIVACDPSLPDSEIQTIVGSVTRYKR